MGGDGAKVSRLMCRSLAPIVLSSKSRFLPAWGERTYSHIFSRMTSTSLTPPPSSFELMARFVPAQGHHLSAKNSEADGL